MRIEVSKFRGRIIEKFGTIDNFAETAKCSRAFVSKYLNHKTFLNQETILLWARLLGISDPEIPAYFFAVEVDEIQL